MVMQQNDNFEPKTNVFDYQESEQDPPSLSDD